MTARVDATLAAVTGWTGRRFLRAALYLLDLATFIVFAFRDWRGRTQLHGAAARRPLISQIIFTGVDALPVITLLGLAIGVSITAQILALARTLGTEEEVIALLADIVGMELGTLITAIVLIGRSGSAIAVDLGNMKLHREIEGLELLGIDVNDFFVAPRLVGASVAQLVLAVYFAGIALFGGVFLSGLLFSNTYYQYLAPLATAFSPLQIVVFVVKNLLFGLIIAGTACFHALRVGVSPTEVPQQTQRAIVNSQILVFVLDGMFAVAVALQ
ncbi:MAG TPA: ABC transporter permease [Gammaproteobacteria bacterium]|nr:ABC transporter permease [Gammaproteobacteria bacterium]